MWCVTLDPRLEEMLSSRTNLRKKLALYLKMCVFRSRERKARVIIEDKPCHRFIRPYHMPSTSEIYNVYRWHNYAWSYLSCYVAISAHLFTELIFHRMWNPPSSFVRILFSKTFTNLPKRLLVYCSSPGWRWFSHINEGLSRIQILCRRHPF